MKKPNRQPKIGDVVEGVADWKGLLGTIISIEPDKGPWQSHGKIYIFAQKPSDDPPNFVLVGSNRIVVGGAVLVNINDLASSKIHSDYVCGLRWWFEHIRIVNE